MVDDWLPRREEGQGMIIACYPKMYEYKGVIIECGYGGPCIIKPNGEPYQRLTKKQAATLLEFCGLSDEETKQYRVGGGCEAYE